MKFLYKYYLDIGAIFLVLGIVVIMAIENIQYAAWFNLSFPIFMGIYYILKTNLSLHKYTTIHLLVLSSIIFILLTDLTNVFEDNTSLLVFGLVFPLGYLLLYVFIIRADKVRIGIRTPSDIIKVLVPSIIFFALFGYFFLDHPNPWEYILILVADLLTTLLIIICLFRVHKKSSFYFGVSASFLLGISNILFLLIKIEYLGMEFFIPMVLSYLLGHYLMIRVFSIEHNIENLPSNQSN